MDAAPREGNRAWHGVMCFSVAADCVAADELAVFRQFRSSIEHRSLGNLFLKAKQRRVTITPTGFPPFVNKPTVNQGD